MEQQERAPLSPVGNLLVAHGKQRSLAASHGKPAAEQPRRGNGGRRKRKPAAAGSCSQQAKRQRVEVDTTDIEYTCRFLKKCSKPYLQVCATYLPAPGKPAHLVSSALASTCIQAACKALGMKSGGNKPLLIDRLLNATSPGESAKWKAGGKTRAVLKQ
jgi:hypothetical protein